MSSEGFLTSLEMARKSKYEHNRRMEYIIGMPYIGGILSENAYKYATRRTKPFVRLWMKELGDKVRQLDIPKCESYEIGVFGRFTDERRPDISNLFKVTSDAIEKGLSIDDKHFRLIDKGYELGWTDPELVITITPMGRGDSIKVAYEGVYGKKPLTEEEMGEVAELFKDKLP